MVQEVGSALQEMREKGDQNSRGEAAVDTKYLIRPTKEVGISGCAAQDYLLRLCQCAASSDVSISISPPGKGTSSMATVALARTERAP